MCTKYRRKCIDAATLARFREIAEARCIGRAGSLLKLNGEADHVHLLITLAPNLDLSEQSEDHQLPAPRKEFADKVNSVYRKPVFWSGSYSIISCGGAPLSIVKQYIEQRDNPN